MKRHRWYMSRYHIDIFKHLGLFKIYLQRNYGTSVDFLDRLQGLALRIDLLPLRWFVFWSAMSVNLTLLRMFTVREFLSALLQPKIV